MEGVDGEPVTDTIIGREGLFYLENLSPGDHRATIRLRGRTCTLLISIPTSAELELDLGELECVLDPRGE